MNPPPRAGRIHPPHPPAPTVKRSSRPFLRSSVVMFLGATLLCVWVTLTRDRNNERAYMAFATERCRQIREHWARTGSLPPVLGGYKSQVRHASLEYYADGDTLFYATRTDQPVVIGFTPLAPMVARRNARGVIIFQDGEISARWMRESDFKRLWAEQQRRVEGLIARVRSRPPDLPG